MSERRPTDWTGKVYPPGHDTKLDHPGRGVSQTRKLSLNEVRALYSIARYDTFEGFKLSMQGLGLL